MRLVHVAIAQVNTTVGAVRSHVDRAVAIGREMAAADVTLGVFQEQLLGGYPAEDLVQWRAFVDAQRLGLLRFAAETQALGTVFAVGLTVEHEVHRYNAAAVVHRGRVLGIVPKEKLPTYNVFYEARTLSQGRADLFATLFSDVPFGDLIFRFDWGVLAVEVCEDAWSPDGPMRRRCYSGAELVANLSASPFRIGVQETRREMLATRSGDNQCVVAYANAVGGQDGLVFDGGGFVCQNGRVVLEAERFRAGWSGAVVDLDRTARLRSENTTWRADALHHLEVAPRVHELVAPAQGADRSRLKYPVPSGANFFLPPPTPTTPADPRAPFCEELLDALALGLGDYFTKCGFSQIGIALSGGRDSLLALLLACRTARRLGREPSELVRTFYMPSRFSSDVPRRAAERIALDVGVPLAISPIDDACARELTALGELLGPGETPTPVTLQNIQARVRAARMWNWANSTGGLFVQTGNMSERSVGYTTIGGDLEGAFSVISNLPKTVVIHLLEYLRDTTGHEGIRLVLSHPAGPELAANQEGEKELMPFPVLDACFALYAGEKLAPDEVLEVLAAMFPSLERARLERDVRRFFELFTRSIYKWVQAPLGIHVGNLDLDRERALQLPVVSSDEWTRR